jgi:hypothetical protein
MSRTQLTTNDNEELVSEHNRNDPLSDCKGVVYSYLSRKLSADAANAAFRTVSACKVNKGTVIIIFPFFMISFPFFCWTEFHKCIANVTLINFLCTYRIFFEVLSCFGTFHDRMMLIWERTKVWAICYESIPLVSSVCQMMLLLNLSRCPVLVSINHTNLDHEMKPKFSSFMQEW